MQGGGQSIKDRNLQWRSSLCLPVHVPCALVPDLARKYSELRNNCNRTKHLWVLEHKPGAQETHCDLGTSSGYTGFEGQLITNLYMHLSC